jgi:hypothetical protein
MNVGSSPLLELLLELLELLLELLALLDAVEDVAAMGLAAGFAVAYIPTCIESPDRCENFPAYMCISSPEVVNASDGSGTVSAPGPVSSRSRDIAGFCSSIRCCCCCCRSVPPE